MHYSSLSRRSFRPTNSDRGAEVGSMDQGSYKLFIAIGTCHRLMKEHATQTRARPGVRDLTHWLDVYDVDDAFRLQEYVDAELSNGQAISWRLELTLNGGAFTVESDVRQIHQDGQDLVQEVADCAYPTAEECAAGIVETTRRLCSIDPL
jgi:hypothetical protein